MRARDYLGILLLVIGISGLILGYHWFGWTWFWVGAAISGVGFAIISSDGVGEKIDSALRSYRGPGDYGNRDYHGGADHSTDSHSGGDE